MNGGGSWCFVGSIVAIQMYELWVMLAGSSGEEEELLGKIDRWDKRERNRFFFFLYLLFDGVVYIILMGCI